MLACPRTGGLDGVWRCPGRPNPLSMKFLFLLLCVLIGARTGAQETNALSLDEILPLIRENLPELTEAELKARAAAGLIEQLGSRVELVTTNAAPSESTSGAAVTRKAMYHVDFGYVRLSNVEGGAPEAFFQAYKNLASSNQIKGLVLDLRFASGRDYEAAGRIADAFVAGGQVLLQFNGKEVRSTDENLRIEVPVAVLVNGETSGAAEALAAVIRQNGAGLVIGSRTAGEARLFENFTLRSGQTLRIGKIPVLLNDGEPFPPEGLHPDLEVTVSPGHERVFFEDPWAPLPRGFADGGTNSTATATNRFIRRINEAELVRRHREGIATELEEESPAVPADPVIMDPALARGLDMLKGISVLRQNRRP